MATDDKKTRGSREAQARARTLSKKQREQKGMKDDAKKPAAANPFDAVKKGEADKKPASGARGKRGGRTAASVNNAKYQERNATKAGDKRAEAAKAEEKADSARGRRNGRTAATTNNAKYQERNAMRNSERNARPGGRGQPGLGSAADVRGQNRSSTQAKRAISEGAGDGLRKAGRAAGPIAGIASGLLALLLGGKDPRDLTMDDAVNMATGSTPAADAMPGGMGGMMQGRPDPRGFADAQQMRSPRAGGAESISRAPVPTQKPQMAHQAAPAQSQQLSQMPFGQAFAQARKQGQQVFDWNGKKYHTGTVEELAKDVQSGAIKPQGPQQGAPQGQPVGAAPGPQRMQGMPGSLQEAMAYSQARRAKAFRFQGQNYEMDPQAPGGYRQMR